VLERLLGITDDLFEDVYTSGWAPALRVLVWVPWFEFAALIVAAIGLASRGGDSNPGYYRRLPAMLNAARQKRASPQPAYGSEHLVLSFRLLCVMIV